MSEYQYDVCQIVEGVIAQVNLYEAIVDISLGGQGTLHVMELSGSYSPDTLSQEYKVGQVDAFRVVSIDRKLGFVGLAPAGNYFNRPAFS